VRLCRLSSTVTCDDYKWNFIVQPSQPTKWRASQNLEYKDSFQLTLELSTGAQLSKLRPMIFGKEDIQSINPTTVPAQSAPLFILAACRKRWILSTTPQYLPPIKRTNPTRNRHCHSRATVLPCDQQTSKQFWKKRRAPIKVISCIILFLKAINTLLDTCSRWRLGDPEFQKK